MTEKEQSPKPLDVKADLQWFMQNLDLQLDDFDLASRDVTLTFYWDTVDIRRAVLGMADFYDASGAFSRSWFEERQTLVCCLAAAGWLGPMRMLPPHQAELSGSLTSGFHLGTEHVPPGGAEQFFRDADLKGPKGLTLRGFHQKSPEQKSQLVAQYAGEAERLFKAVQCVRGNWKERLASMHNSKLVDLYPKDEVNYLDIFNGRDFEAFRTFFDKRRSTRRVNNFTDATALCLLQRQVLEFNDAGGCSLPRFFESSSLFREAVAETGLLDSLCYQSRDGTRLSVLRDCDYYVFRATFNPPRDLAHHSSHQKLFESLKSVRDKVKQILDASGPLSADLMEEVVIEGRPLTTVIKDLRQYSFLEEVWLPYAAGQTLAQAASEYVRRLVKVGGDDQFKGTVSEAIEDVKRVLETNAREYKWLSDLWRSLEASVDNFQRKFPASATEPPDVFKVFALLRFGVPPEYHSQVGQIVHGLLGGEEEDTHAAITALFRACRDAKYKRHENRSRSVAMCVLWILEMDSVIHDLSTQDADEPSWLVAIAGASAIRCNRYAAGSRAVKELETRYDRSADSETRGSLALSLAYLYFHLWRYGGGEVKWRNDRHMPSEHSPQDVERWIASAIEFSEKAYAAKHRLPATKAYALNLYLYYVTEGAADAQVLRAADRAEELMNCQSDPSVWQYRFDDTLSRYFHRRSVMSSSPDDKKQRLVVAKKYIAAAARECHGDPVVASYESVLANISVGTE